MKKIEDNSQSIGHKNFFDKRLETKTQTRYLKLEEEI